MRSQMTRPLFPPCLWVLVLTASLAHSAKSPEVLDLGKMEWKGKARGPQVEMLDSNRMDKAAAKKLTEYLLRKIEDKILGTESVQELEVAE